MNDSDAARGSGALPELILYSRPGCHLCEDARTLIEHLLAERARAGRPNPPFRERDITTDDGWERAFFATIPVIELGARRIDLATSAAKIRALLGTLDAPAVASA